MSNVAYPQLVNPTPVSYAVFNSPVANAILKNNAELSMQDQMSRLQEENRSLQRRIQHKNAEISKLSGKVEKVENELEQYRQVLNQVNGQIANNGHGSLGEFNLKGKQRKPAKVKKNAHSSSSCQCCCLDKPYICDFESCGKRFRQKPHLEAHRAIHTGRRFICEWPNCGKSFVRKYNLQEHTKMHAPGNPNMCTFHDCGKMFSSKYSLVRHQNAQHNLNL